MEKGKVELIIKTTKHPQTKQGIVFHAGVEYSS